MRRPIPTASKIGSPALSVKGSRKNPSWIESFVEHTNNIDSPVLFRRWAAISTLAAVLEQKVWLVSGGSHLYPNLYVLLIGHPGVGKTRTVRIARRYMMEIPEFNLAPTSMTAASLVDVMVASKRAMIRLPEPPLEYNTTCIVADELGTFVHKYDDEMIAVLSAFYDPDPYGHNRRGKDIKIKIQKPQLNILAGSTPSNLMKFLPEGAWDQGFMSRTIMVFSDERTIKDDFAFDDRGMSKDLLADLAQINSLVGEVKVTDEYKEVVRLWRESGEQPIPTHPKLIHYSTRRRAHLYKLSIIAAADRSDVLLITKDDFNTALNWLHHAEVLMPEVFKAGAVGVDSQAMEEIAHFIRTLGSVPEYKVIDFARERVPAHSVMRVLEIMELSGMIVPKQVNSLGMRFWQTKASSRDDQSPSFPLRREPPSE